MRIFIVIMTFINILITSSSAENLKLVTGDHRPPFSDRKYPGNGLATLIADRIMNIADYTFSNSWRPWNRGLFETETGAFDVAYPYTINSKNIRKFHFSKPLLTIHSALYTLEKRIDIFSKNTQLNPKKICVTNYYPYKELAKFLNQKGYSLVVMSNLNKCISMLSFKKVDGFITFSDMLEDISKNIKIAPITFPPINYYFLVSKQNPKAKGILKKINYALTEYFNSGQYDKDISEYKKKTLKRAMFTRYISELQTGY